MIHGRSTIYSTNKFSRLVNIKTTRIGVLRMSYPSSNNTPALEKQVQTPCQYNKVYYGSEFTFRHFTMVPFNLTLSADNIINFQIPTSSSFACTYITYRKTSCCFKNIRLQLRQDDVISIMSTSKTSNFIYFPLSIFFYTYDFTTFGENTTFLDLTLRHYFCTTLLHR